MTRLWIGGVALLLLVAGCGGDPKADPSPTPTSPRTSPVSTTPSAPAMPEEAKADTKAGAVAFVKYYIGVFNRAQATGSTDALAALSAVDCQDCQAAIDGLKKIYRAGGAILGGDLEPGPATVAQNAAERRWLVLVRVESGPQSVVNSVGAAPKTLPGGRRPMKFDLAWARGAWKVTSWTRA